jgi:hypothetical protein
MTESTEKGPKPQEPTVINPGEDFRPFSTESVATDENGDYVSQTYKIEGVGEFTVHATKNLGNKEDVEKIGFGPSLEQGARRVWIELTPQSSEVFKGSFVCSPSNRASVAGLKRREVQGDGQVKYIFDSWHHNPSQREALSPENIANPLLESFGRLIHLRFKFDSRIKAQKAA